MTAFSGPDSLKISQSAAEVSHLYVIGSIHGVIPLLAAARNGPGSGQVSSSGDGRWLHWRAPGSSRVGNGIRCLTDGDYLLCDGDDTDKWLRVTVDVSELAGGSREAQVELADTYNNPIASDDITSGQAAAGNVETYTLTLANQSNTILSQLKAWIDLGVVNIEIADDGATWVTPTSKSAALDLPDLLPGVEDTLHVRRTITAGAGSEPGLLTLLHFSYRG